MRDFHCDYYKLAIIMNRCYSHLHTVPSLTLGASVPREQHGLFHSQHKFDDQLLLPATPQDRQ